MPLSEFIARINNETDLDKLLDISVNCNTMQTTAEADKKVVNARIKALMLEAGLNTETPYVRADGFAARLGTRITKTINRVKLIAKNVDPAVIDDCTDETESEVYVTVTAPRKKGEKDANA